MKSHLFLSPTVVEDMVIVMDMVTADKGPEHRFSSAE